MHIFTEQLLLRLRSRRPDGSAGVQYPTLNPLGARLRAIFASDIGHWDVPDFRDVLHEAWELVEDGHLDDADFRAFTFGNPVALWAGANPSFFDGTIIEGTIS